MPIAVTCGCGMSYSLRDEYAGATMQCPTCQRTFVAEAEPPVLRVAQADEAFDRDKFLLRQKVIAINQKYAVTDEHNRPILFIERPAHVLQNLGAALAAVVAFVIVMAGAVGLVIAIAPPEGTRPSDAQAIGIVVVLVLGVIAALAAALLVGIPLSAKRHVHVYRDETRTQKLMDILQDRKFQLINWTFTVRDASGQTLALLHKNVLYNLFRKRWYCYGPDGKSMICIAKEDSAILSLLRRFLGPMYGLLRTNFIICRGQTEDVIGEFNRKFTLFDRYVLDLSADPTRTLDRRVALGLGVMLDSGERR